MTYICSVRHRRDNCISLILVCISLALLPNGSEKKGVWGVGNIHVLPSCQDMISYLDKPEYNYLGSKNKNHYRGSTEATMHPLSVILTATYGPWSV